LLLEVLDFFFGLGRIVAVYEPADPFFNSYNVNVLFESATDVWAEVLGPGFDASDLQRGDLSPHEVFSISLTPKGVITEIQRVHRVDQPEYETSKQLRWQKMRRKLEQSPTPRLARAIRSDLKLPQKLERHLKTLRSPLFEAQHYVPVSETLLTNTVSAIVRSGIINLFSSSTGIGFPLNFSTSLIDGGRRQVYWDIVSPALKFQGLKT
jgi:hypothetical protein